MIDDPEKTDRLLVELKASLPVETKLSQNLIRTLSEQSPDLMIPASCSVVSIFYAGEEGGIVWLGHRRFKDQGPALRIHHPSGL